MKTPHTVIAALAAATFITLTAPQARAALLVEEQFDYATGTSGGGFNGGTGFDAGTWAGGASSMSSVSNVAVAGLTMGTGTYVLDATGSALRQQATNDGTAAGDLTLSRGLNTSLGAGNDLWIAFLFQANIGTTAGRALITSIDDPVDADLQLLPKANNSAVGPIRELSGGPSALLSASVTDSNVYLMIGRYGLGTNGDTVSVAAWALDEADFDIVSSDGVITEAELNATNHASASASGTLTNNTLLDLDDTFVFSMVPLVANISLAATYDELRLGTTLADVTPLENTVVIPTPAALPAGLLLLSLAGSRRRW